MFNKRKIETPPEWKPQYEGAPLESLWQVLQQYDFEIITGEKGEHDRYNSIKPFAKNMWHDPVAVPYFNASKYELTQGVNVVAMQAPLPHTMEDFVMLAIKDNVTTILTLGEPQEGVKSKMEVYWDGYDMREHEITCERDIEKHEGYIIRRLLFKRKTDGRVQEVRHIHFYAWPDHLTPDPHIFQRVLDYVILQVQATPQGILVVHCSAGVGRTGTFLAGLKIALEKQRATPRAMFEAVGFIKNQRFLSVESREQFEFLSRGLPR